jgi:hypothetical protein
MVTTQVNVKHTCKTQRTLLQVTLQKCCASFAHRVRRVLQSVDALEPSVFVPCLQIRVGRFDSGSRLHYFQFLLYKAFNLGNQIQIRLKRQCRAGNTRYIGYEAAPLPVIAGNGSDTQI